MGSLSPQRSAHRAGVRHRPLRNPPRPRGKPSAPSPAESAVLRGHVHVLRRAGRGTYPMVVPLSLRVRRLGYRIAYRLLQAFWFAARPDVQGVKCLVTDRDRVLLVRHTYGRRTWDVPGGSIKRRESPVSAAHREMSEELGLDGVHWSDIGQLRGRLDYRHDTIHCFRVELDSPRLRLNQAELEAAQWFSRGRLPDDVSPYVGAIVAAAAAIPTQSCRGAWR